MLYSYTHMATVGVKVLMTECFYAVLFCIFAFVYVYLVCTTFLLMYVNMLT